LQEWYEEHWNAGEDVTPEILRVIERHTREYTPFEVYAKALYELHRRQEMTDAEWFAQQSRVYPVLDRSQKDGFHRLLEIPDPPGQRRPGHSRGAAPRQGAGRREADRRGPPLPQPRLRRHRPRRATGPRRPQPLALLQAARADRRTQRANQADVPLDRHADQ